MRYLQSAALCSLTDTCLTTECIKYTGWGVGIGYSAIITILLACILVSFPGYYDEIGSMAQFYVWYYGLYKKITLSITSVWTVLTIASTIASIYAIRQIFATN
jgi:hypothetical protein